jgi:hypothetical protein
MTPGERSLWRAVYAASWHQSTGAPMGKVEDCERARWCATQADRALEAARGLVAKVPGGWASPSKYAAEVLE